MSLISRIKDVARMRGDSNPSAIVRETMEKVCDEYLGPRDNPHNNPDDVEELITVRQELDEVFSTKTPEELYEIRIKELDMALERGDILPEREMYYRIQISKELGIEKSMVPKIFAQYLCPSCNVTDTLPFREGKVPNCVDCDVGMHFLRFKRRKSTKK